MALLFSAAGVTAIAAPASADNINTSGVICQNFNAAQALDIDYFGNRVENVNAAARTIVCAIPRSPLATIPPTFFFVDGHNNPNTVTSCTVTVYDFQGNVRLLQSFTENGGAAGLTWDFPVNMLTPAGMTPAFFDYASLVCTIPASRGGSIFGVTAVQP
ncbi:MAG TPA: hypothetical protein VGD37_28195 [Kofleriaceae bacterium]